MWVPTNKVFMGCASEQQGNGTHRFSTTTSGGLGRTIVRPDYLQKSVERWFNLLEYLTVKIVLYILFVIGLVEVVRHAK